MNAVKEEKEIKPELTKTVVLDCGRKCNILCKFCYYAHLGDLRKLDFLSFEECTKIIDDGYDRGCRYIDVTGGEGSIHPDMPEIIKYGLRKGMPTCIITNGIADERRTQKLIDAGIDEFLVSIHGMEKVHNETVQHPSARKRQIRFINQIKDAGVKLRFNFVINQHNQDDVFNVSEWMGQFDPKIVNFINFNPHEDWAADKEGTQKIIANLDIVQPLLEKSIDHLERDGIGVNIRYYPMCRMRADLRRTICNDLHVQFDPFEWDYSNQMEFHTVREIWKERSRVVEEKGEPCNGCDLQWVCGGANKYFHAAHKEIHGDCLEAQKGSGAGHAHDFYYYRKHNFLTLFPRV